LRATWTLRQFVVACAFALLCYPGPAAAQNWPSRFITLVVPFGPGSGTDIVARIIAARVSEILGQQIVVENVGGAGGMIGVTRVAKAAPDGYTMVLGAVDTFAQSQSIHKTMPYDPVADFVPAGLAVEQPLVLVTRKDMPASNLKEFAAYMRANHGKMQFGSAGVGGAPHLACSQFANAVGVNITHVPYRSSAPALTDLVAGNLDFYCPLAVGAIRLIEEKTVKALAVLTQERSPLMPDLATAKEQGFDNIDGYYWMGFFFPKGTPQSIVETMNAALNEALDTPSVQARLKEVATSVVPKNRRSPAYLKDYVDSEIKKWAATVKASGITPQ
jgi:tripartite-type tricarboxylate transporter receptor subunit TctC